MIGEIQMNFVPDLYEFGFDSGVTSVKQVDIVDTSLASLDGLAFTEIVHLNLTQNERLNTVNLPLINSSGVLMFAENGEAMELNMPDLSTVNELFISSVAQIKLPSLQKIQSTAKFDTNYFTTFSAPFLQSCGGDLSIVNNPSLESFLLQQLSSVEGSLLVTDNSQLSIFAGFKIESVGNDIELRGNFTE
ncbi:cell wall protein Ecm33 [Gnomoniopsis sp. IMI 355080]|nr:cell wall protein Ecm33 [Gnomoniopsis sp. IMI 355080]